MENSVLVAGDRSFFAKFLRHQLDPILYGEIPYPLGWWWLEHVLFFHSVGTFIIPIDELIFFRGVGLNHQPHSIPIHPWYLGRIRQPQAVRLPPARRVHRDRSILGYCLAIGEIMAIPWSSYLKKPTRTSSQPGVWRCSNGKTIEIDERISSKPCLTGGKSTLECVT